MLSIDWGRPGETRQPDEQPGTPQEISRPGHRAESEQGTWILPIWAGEGRFVTEREEIVYLIGFQQQCNRESPGHRITAKPAHVGVGTLRVSQGNRAPVPITALGGRLEAQGFGGPRSWSPLRRSEGNQR